MRKLLRWILNFIETRFPEKVTVTKEKFDELLCEQTRMDRAIIRLEKQSDTDNDRISDIEKDSKQNKVDIIDARKLIITLSEILNNLGDQFKNLKQMMDKRVQNEELFAAAVSTIDKSLIALKEGIVKGEIRTGITERDRERQDFINGITPRNMPSRRELEAAADHK